MSTHTIKGLRAEFKAVGKFHTPPELALFLRSLIPGVPERVYDPTCGAGALLSVFPEEVAKFGQDIDAEAVADAGMIPGFTGHVGDVLTDPAWVDERFDAVVANPPFSIEWEPQADERFFGAPTVPTKGRADFAFLLHILWMLAPGGTAAVLQFPGVCYRQGREKTLREWITRQGVLAEVIQIPGDTFTDTAISTVCLVFRKGHEGPVRFFDQESGVEALVPVEGIGAEDWSWAVSVYARPPEPDREPVDTWALEVSARSGACRKLRSELKFSRAVAQIEGWPFAPFLDDIQKVVEEMRGA